MEPYLKESTWSDGKKEQLWSLASDFSDGKLGLTDPTEYEIKMVPGTTSVCKCPYHLTPAMQGNMDKGLKAFFVKNSSGGFCPVVNYRGLNTAAIPKNLRIPGTADVFDTIGEN